MYGYRTRPAYPGNYHPRYSEDPRYLGDPRYYGGGGPRPYGGSALSGKANTGMIFGCALFGVILVVALIGGLAVGLALGLSGSSPSSGASTGNGDGTNVVTMTTASPNGQVNLCSSTPCTNGGTCVPVNSGFSCSCPPGFSGSTCGVAESACSSNPCSNGGTCSLSGSSGFSCSCPFGYQGTTCTLLASRTLSATCPPDQVVVIPDGETSVEVTWDPPVVFNADGPATITYTRPMGEFTASNLIGVTVTDSSETFQCDFLITVQDEAELLTVTCPGSINVGTDPGQNSATLSYGSPTVTGSRGVPDIRFDPARGTPLPVGQNNIVVTVMNSGQVAMCNFLITVSDEEGPVLTGCPSDATVSTEPGRGYADISWSTPTATDNTGGMLPVTVTLSPGQSSISPGQFTVGRYTLIATATDSHDNEGSCSWTYTVIDDERPVIVCPSSYPVRVPSGLESVVLTYVDDISATDNVLLSDINVTPSDIYPVRIGQHIVVAIATDSSGNTASCSFEITVSESCGLGQNTLTPRIIGGVAVNPGQFPWQVSILRGSHYCGGVIIDEQWILSAAHCNVMVNDQIIAGDVSLSSASATRQTRSIQQVYNHPSYTDINNEYDITLLRLDQPLPISNEILPVCLATEAEEASLFGSNSCWVAGWGVDSNNMPAVAVEDLMAVMLPNILTSTECVRDHGLSLTSVSLCASDLAGGRDACTGDSGGGLVCPDINNRWHSIGVVSSGQEMCAQPNEVGVYTRVSQYNDFIYAYLGADLEVVEFGNTATMVSPTVPGTGQYPDNVVKGWRYRRFGGRAIQLEFTVFDLFTGDTLVMGRGLNPWDDSTQEVTFGSTFTERTMEVAREPLTDIWFRFQSNRSGRADGFSIVVKVIN